MLSFSQKEKKKWIEICLKEPSKWGGVRNHFSILMSNRHQQPSPREVYFYAKSAQGKHFQPYCIIWPKTFFSTPILLFHMQQNTHKGKTESERRWGVNLKRCNWEDLWPSSLGKIIISVGVRIVTPECFGPDLPPQTSTDNSRPARAWYRADHVKCVRTLKAHPGNPSSWTGPWSQDPVSHNS